VVPTGTIFPLPSKGIIEKAELEQMVWFCGVIIIGLIFTVNVTVFRQPLELVYVIIVVPLVNAVTNPVSLIVATAGFEDDQGEVMDAVAEPINCAVKPIHTDKAPPIVGCGFIVTVTGLIIEQPFAFVAFM
jgi:hypothetical protein